eukprot:IDg9001t1
MRIIEFDSESRQMQVQSQQEGLKLDSFMAEKSLSLSFEELNKIGDLIERQTLFFPWDFGSMKTKCAISAAPSSTKMVDLSDFGTSSPINISSALLSLPCSRAPSYRKISGRACRYCLTTMLRLRKRKLSLSFSAYGDIRRTCDSDAAALTGPLGMYVPLVPLGAMSAAACAKELSHLQQTCIPKNSQRAVNCHAWVENRSGKALANKIYSKQISARAF